MSYRWMSVPVLAGAFLLAACSASSQQPAGPQTAAEIPQGAAAVSYEAIEEVSTPISGILERMRVVIRDENSWDDFWNEFVSLVEPRPIAPAIDFSTHMVIAATMGQQTSGGYTISVEEVAEKDGTLYAAVQEVTPGALCITTDVITAPAVAVTVPRHDGPVAVVERELALPCAP